MASWLSLSQVVVGLFILLLVPPGLCGWEGEWDPDELDIFDLVEEIGENFYDIMQVDQVRWCVCTFRADNLWLHRCS